ncbi:MAG: UDP-N-acetylmuramate dehydrogenase [Gammaproteobacteria bacterium]|nr:UDP-N-acetylmuramate dehydrogenase [Gammaproteobacteria bacterium]
MAFNQTLGSTMDHELNIRGTVSFNEPMSKHTSWRVGGPAEKFFKPADIDDVSAYLKSIDPNEPILFVGLGSNLLVRDGGISGTVILTNGLLNGLEMISPTQIRAEAGVACGKVARFAAKNSLTGIEFLAGIPGSMGGALRMNAGAFGGETWDWVSAVETMDRNGERHLRIPQEFEVGYRTVKGREDEWFVAAHLSLQKGDGEAALSRIKQLLARRNESQPTNLPNCGSVFRNPEDDFSARLIESAGLKGLCIGGACVSEKHANFIINSGNARAMEIEQLIEKVAATVEQIHGIRLVREVHIVGNAAEAGE